MPKSFKHDFVYVNYYKSYFFVVYAILYSLINIYLLSLAVSVPVVFRTRLQVQAIRLAALYLLALYLRRLSVLYPNRLFCLADELQQRMLQQRREQSPHINTSLHLWLACKTLQECL